jgi:hypothetical protein
MRTRNVYQMLNSRKDPLVGRNEDGWAISKESRSAQFSEACEVSMRQSEPSKIAGQDHPLYPAMQEGCPAYRLSSPGTGTPLMALRRCLALRSMDRRRRPNLLVYAAAC